MPSPALEQSRDAEVVVIGVGLAGAAIACELARGRRRVVALEAGALSAGSDVGHVRVGLGLPYGAAVRGFGREAAREIWLRHRESRLRLESVLRLLGRGCGYRQAGGFRLTDSREGGLSLGEGEDLLREDGFSGEFFDHHMLEARFDVQGLAAGYWAADDAELDAQALLAGLASVAEQTGVAVHERSPVVELELSAAGAVAVTRSGARVRAPLAVVAAGSGSGVLLPGLAARLLVSDERQLRLEGTPQPCFLSRDPRLTGAWLGAPRGRGCSSAVPSPKPSSNISWASRAWSARARADPAPRPATSCR